jgi:hypothetical protein
MTVAAVLRNAPRPARGLRASLAETWRAVSERLFDSYRPERHYMRGPGPRWHAKHAALAQPAFAPIR